MSRKKPAAKPAATDGAGFLKKIIIPAALAELTFLFIIFSENILPALYAVASGGLLFYSLSWAALVCILYMLTESIKNGRALLMFLVVTAAAIIFFYMNFWYRMCLSAFYILLIAFLYRGTAILLPGKTIFTDVNGFYFKAASAMLGTILFFSIIRNGWVSDDAYITLRTVDNFVNGYGPRWNVFERVQAYTHPLWMLLVSCFYFFARDAFYTVIAVSVAAAAGAIALYAFQFRKKPPMLFAGLIMMFLSEAFIEFSTSGLENPLTYLFIALFFLVSAGKKSAGVKKVFLLSLISGLAAFNRMDTLLLLAPALVYQALAVKKPGVIKAVLAGFTPFFIWELFSVVYYGFPFPNTYYAKVVDTGWSVLFTAFKGFKYLLNLAEMQPVTLFVIASGIIAGLLSYKKNRPLFFLSLGPLLYTLYVVIIGGDFMAGRFFAAPFFMMVFVISYYEFDPKKPEYVSFFALIFLFAVISPYTPITGGAFFKWGVRDSNNVAYEKSFYIYCSGLAAGTADKYGTPVPYCEWAIDGRNFRIAIEKGRDRVYVTNNTGYVGYFAGPKAYIIDRLALTDAFLSRIRPVSGSVGHLSRALPGGYVQTLRTGSNMIETPELKEFYDRLCVVTKGPIFSAERFREIFNFNTGKYRKLASPKTIFIDTTFEEQDKGVFE